jgi:FHS family glucose/mannose:H+ symporter-like MFS transporter
MGSRIIGSNPTSTSNAKLPFSNSGATLLHLDFLVTGIVMTFLGPMLPALSARWSLTDEQAGYLLFAQFFSSMFGMLASASLVQRVGYRLTFIIGLLMMALGMSLLVSGPWLLGMAAVCVLGFGHGVTTPAGNLRTAEVNPERRASALSVINAVWGIGAVSSPFLAALAQRAHRTPLLLYGTAAALLALLLAFAFARFEPDTRAQNTPSSSPGDGVLNHRMLLVICALFFVYVGTEVSFGGWLASYAHRMGTSQHSYWVPTTSFFWGALLVGRTLAPAALKFHKETAVARIGLVVALVGGLTIVAAQGMALLILGAILAGLGMASIFPISVSLLPRWFEESAASSSSFVFASGNTGGAVLPWLVGVISTRTGSLRSGFIVPLLGVAAMLGFYVVAGSPGARTATRT